ncbi:MAG TPA: hypothetical protein VHJ69_09235, partial [Gemmatimonadales bacterium]|nr:hypothetical protein [Gemmatimonadales bacterium]
MSQSEVLSRLTGNELGGGVVAMIVGLIGMALARLALRPPHRMTPLGQFRRDVTIEVWCAA